VVVLGLSHHTAGVDVRERLAVPEDAWADAAGELVGCGSVREAAVMSTCNRFEVYLIAGNGFEAIASVVQALSEKSGIPPAELRRSLFMLTGDEAIWHLLRVAGGLDSLVIGEGQILSQVKRCYEIAGGKAGHAGKVLARLLNTAVTAGKRVRNETGISKGAVSISSAAVELADMRAVADLDIPLVDARVVILGAGKMSRLLVQHLASRGVADITVVNRTMPRAEELQKMFPDTPLKLLLADGMLAAVGRADIVFASTSAVDPVLTRENLAPVLQGGRRCMLVDISVPRNVAGDAGAVAGAVPYNVDDLKAVVAKNQARRRRLMLEAESLLCDERTTFNNWHHSLGCVPAISKLQQRAESIRADEMERVRGKLADLEPSEAKAVEQLSRGIINKMLHSPMVHLRGLEDMQERSQTLDAIEALFRL
jgi:glutamyl-tRNA reductase